jgi:hypothetical protein
VHHGEKRSTVVTLLAENWTAAMAPTQTIRTTVTCPRGAAAVENGGISSYTHEF